MISERSISVYDSSQVYMHCNRVRVFVCAVY